MERTAISLFMDGKSSELTEFMKGLKTDELLTSVKRALIQGKREMANLVRSIFAGCSAASEDGNMRRLLVLKHIIDLFQTLNLSTEITTELTGLLLNEIDTFPSALLIELVNYYIEGIKTGTITSSKCLELFPKVLSTLEVKDTLDVNGNEMKGSEFKSHVLNSLCSCRWNSRVVLHVMSMMRDIALTNEELSHVIAKSLRQLTEMDQNELPPLVYQLLLLSAKGHKKMVLDGVISYFVQQDEKHAADSGVEQSEEQFGLSCGEADVQQQLHHVEGTVILHITFAVKQDQQLGREFVSYFKTYKQFSYQHVLSPFNVALALSIGRIHSFEEQIFELLKSSIGRSYRDAEICRLSRWVRDLVPFRSDVAELVLETIKNSIVGWDHITEGLVQLGFALMESYGPKTCFGKLCAASAVDGQRRLTPTQAACRLGVRILQDTFRVHESSRAAIVEQTLNFVVTRASSSVSHYIDLLTSTIKSYPHVILESVSRLRETFDYLMLLPLTTADGLLRSIQPLLKLSPTLRDGLVIVLRKAIFSRQIESRRVAVSGFLMLLNNFNTLAGNFMSSQSASQSSCVSSSQVMVDVHVRHTESQNEALCLEILSMMRRCLAQQADIRLILYEGLYNVLKSNSQLVGSILRLLSDQFRCYFEPSSNTLPPVKLDACIVLQAEQPYVAEPLAHLLSSLVHSILHKKTRGVGSGDEDDDDGSGDEIVSSAEDMLRSLVERMVKCEPEDFELDKSADFSALTSVGVRNTIFALLVSGVYEVLIEYEFFSANYDVSRCERIVKLFGNYQQICEVLKDTPSSAAGGGGHKKKGRPTKDVLVSGKDSLAAGKTPGGMFSIHFLSAALTALYSDNSADRQDGIKVLQSSVELQQHLVTSAVARLQQIAQRGHCDGVQGHTTDHLIKYCSAIGRDLLVRYSSSHASMTSVSAADSSGINQPAESAKLRALVSSCLEGVAQTTALFCSRYSHRLWHFLKALDQEHASDKVVPEDGDEQVLIAKHIQRFQRMTVLVLTAGGEDRPVHDAATLLTMIGQLCQLLDGSSSAVADIESWLFRLCKEQTVDDLSVVKCLVQLTLTVTRHHSSAVELCRDIARDLHICVGDIDQEVEVDASHKTFGVIGVRVAPSVVHILMSQVDIEVDDLEWVVARMKAASAAELPSKAAELTQKESAEKCVYNRIGHIINTFHELLQTALPVGPCVDGMMRVVYRLYLLLTTLVKWSLMLYARKNGYMSTRFEKLVKLSGTNLTQSVYPMITYVQASQAERLQVDTDKIKKKKGKTKSLLPFSEKSRVLKETRSIPNLIYAVEQYEKYLIQLSKKSKVDLMQHFKMSTSRDFRINAASLQAAMEQAAAAEESGDSDASADSDDQANVNGTAQDLPGPAAKRPRTQPTQLKSRSKLSKK